MSDNTLVHIFGCTPHHYVPMKHFLQKVGRGASFNQQFWAWDIEGKASREDFTYYPDYKALLDLMKSQGQGTQFIFHGMFDRHLWPRLAFSGLPTRCSWVCWGAELYEHGAENKTIKRRIAHFFHRKLVRKFNRVFALNRGDGELIQKLIVKRNVNSLAYPLIDSTAVTRSKVDSKVKVLIGNSANTSNDHEAILRSLADFSNREIEVIAPLNYAGSDEYVAAITKLGEDIFADKFVPITNMLDKTEYDQLLADVDIAIFAHQRQQGLYVVYSMMKYGKKMYMRRNVSSFTELNDKGFTLFDFEEIKNQSFEQFVEQGEGIGLKNKDLMQNVYSEEALLPKWQNQIDGLFNGINQ